MTNCVFGLRRMTSNAPAVLEILAALVRRIRSCKREFVSQNCSNCLYGLQGFSSDKIEVREVLTALVPHVRATNEGNFEFSPNSCPILTLNITTSLLNPP